MQLPENQIYVICTKKKYLLKYLPDTDTLCGHFQADNTPDQNLAVLDSLECYLKVEVEQVGCKSKIVGTQNSKVIRRP